MIKRLLDILFPLVALILFSPLFILFMFLIWASDLHSPFYVAQRIGRQGRMFKMIKLRSMMVKADQTGVDSTSSGDKRITAVGRFLRTYKIDEIAQLVNVLKGDMSLVGPRPNVKRDVDLYTEAEKKLLAVKPGMTDLASIVFADEGEILKGSLDADLHYNQVIRPWKSRLGLIYVENRSLPLDLKLIALTIVSLFSREKALNGIQRILEDLQADEKIKEICKRNETLQPYPPPGSLEIVTSR